MKIINTNWLTMVAISFCLVATTACESDNDPEAVDKGQIEIAMTDAPSDDEHVRGVFVTLADVKIDGVSLPNFVKQTFDIKAYQDGMTKLVGVYNVDVKEYSNITFVFDLDTDENGEAPGTYVLTDEKAKIKLKDNDSGLMEISVNKNWSVSSTGRVSLVADLDLRKSIIYTGQSSSLYQFVDDQKIQTALRVSNLGTAGSVKGEYIETPAIPFQRTVVYAYANGAFSQDELSTDGNSAQFDNAIASAEVKLSDDKKLYTLAFLEAGEYELYAARYVRNSATGKQELNRVFRISAEDGRLIRVQSGVTTTATINANTNAQPIPDKGPRGDNDSPVYY